MNKTILKKISVVATVAIIIAPLFSCHPDGPEDFIDYVYDSGNEGNDENNDENSENKNENDWSYPTSKPKELWSGSGTYYNPYIIKTAQDLANLSYMVNNYGYSYESYYFKLNNDINLNYGISVNANSSNAKQWTSIGKNINNSFKGNFNGNSHTIDGLYNSSLFGYISDGSVKNLTMGTGYIKNGYDYKTGSIAGYIKEATISNCKNNGTIVTSSDGSTGGLVGEMEDSEISDSLNHASVTSTYSTATGGIVGYMSDSSSISNSYNYAKISSSYGYAGGIAGYADNNSYCSDCHNSGKVSGYYTKGDIIGNKE